MGDVPKPESRSKMIWGWLSAAAAVVAILTYLGLKPAGIKPMEKKSENNTIVNITSHNQQGGITAQNVFITQNLPKPQLEVKQLEANVPENGMFRSRENYIY